MINRHILSKNRWKKRIGRLHNLMINIEAAQYEFFNFWDDLTYIELCDEWNSMRNKIKTPNNILLEDISDNYDNYLSL